jgi:hypothetical protein
MPGVLDLLLDLPLLHPEAGLQNSASNRKWLTIAEKRALTWRSLPRPTLSTAVRILWDGRLPLFRQHRWLERKKHVGKLLAIDLGKRSFHCHGVDSDGVIISRKTSRSKRHETIKDLAPETIAMEACASAHYWGGRFLPRVVGFF